MARFASWLPVMVLGLLVLGQAPLPGAEQEQAPDAAAFEAGLDFETLLHGSDVMPDSLGDGVWTIQPPPGRMLVRFPLAIELADDAQGPVALSGPPIDLRGGRFVAWHIIEPDESVQSGRRGGGPAGFRADSRNIPPELFGGFDRPGTPLRREVDPRLTGAVDAAADGLATGLPDGTPRFTRKLTLQPDGKIYWKLERFIPGGETSASANDAGYALKLNPQLLAEQQPERPAAQRNTGGPSGDPRAAADARREAQIAYREQINAFRELQQAVRALPDEFTVSKPEPIWVVFDLPSNTTTLAFNGPAPLPWTIGVNDLEALRTLAGRSVGGNALDNESYSAVAAMSGMLRSDHPLTHRLVAQSLSSAGAVSVAEPGDVLYRVLDAIIKGPDAEARNIVLTDLATTIPPTSATIALQRDAFDVMDPAQKIMSLRSQFQVDASDPAKLQEMLAGANAALRDEGLADAGGVLMAVVDAVEPESDGRGRGRGPAPGGAADAIPAVVSGINFDGLPETRRDQAIAYVIREAGARQVPAGWLNHRLIGAGDPALVQRTLELIGEAGSPADVVGPFTQRFVAAVFGEPVGEASAVAQLDLQMGRPLPIDSTSHSIYRVLNSGDPATREKAWRALPNFEVTDERGVRGGRPTGVSAGSGPDRFALVLDAALSQQPTPRSAARFFAEHDQSSAATGAMVMLVVEGDDAAAATAARKLEGSGQPIGAALIEIEPSRRGAFGNRVYAALSPEPTWVGGLLRDPNDRAQLNRWFGEQLAAGELPTEAQWAEQFRNEDDLFQLASGQDVDLSRGAVAALVGSAGGDRRAAEELAATFGAASDRSASGLKTLWIEAKKDIYGRRLAEAAGQYRLIVDIGPPDTGAGAPPFGQNPGAYGFDPRAAVPGYVPGGAQPVPSGPTDAQANDPNKTIKATLGVVDLIADGQSVRFGGDPFELTVPDDYLAIRIDRVAKLKNFEDPDLADVDLESVSQPLDLRVQPDETWEGEVRLSDGRVLRLTLEPIESE